MDKHAAAHVLDQIASFLELKGDNPFRVRAFRNAAEAVQNYGGDIAASLRDGSLADVTSIGPATLDVVREVMTSGRSSVLEGLKREVPEGLVEMLRIQGLGVAKVRALNERLRITTVAELEVAARDGRVAALPRFGDKTAARILRGIQYLRRTGDQHLLHHALRQAEQFLPALRAVPGVRAAEITGSVRRRLELVRDIDVAIATDADPRTISERLASFAGVRDVVGSGDETFTVHFQAGITTKVWVGRPDTFGHLLVRTTGNKGHLVALLALAGAKGLALGATGLTRAGTAVACPDEVSFYRALGLPFIPPELREGSGEVEQAARGRLPALVERGDLRGFIHCHTVYSDGTNTVAELAEACRAAGYGYVGITDHSETSAFAGGLSEEALLKQHAEIDAFNRTARDIRVLKGIEADILEDGALDYTSDFLDRFDFVIGSIHTRFQMDEPAMTRRVLKAMDDPHLAIIGHPTGRLLLDREAYGIDMDQVIARAAERGVAIEINADPQRLDMGWELCRQARAAGVSVPISADAHSVAGLGNVDFGIAMARKAGLEKADVLNTRHVEGFLEHAKARR